MVSKQDLQKGYGLFENMPVAYTIFRVESSNAKPLFSFYYANNLFLKLYGINNGNLFRTAVLSCLPVKQKETYLMVATAGKKNYFYDYNRNLKKYLKIYCYQPIIGYCACLIDDVTEYFNLQRLFKIRAQSDSLTGLYNKESTHEHIINYLKNTAVRNKVHAMLVLDLDNFKEINDLFGHIYGDGLLLEISNRIKSLFRSNDIVGRIGGDEFMIFMKNIKNHNIVRRKVGELCTLINEKYNYFNANLRITTSIGIAFYPDAGTDFDSLYNKADIALYKAKGKGKNQYYIYNDNDIESEYQDIIYYNSKHKKNKLVDKINRLLVKANSPVMNLKAAIAVLCEYYGFQDGFLYEKSHAAYRYQLICHHLEGGKKEEVYPEKSKYLYDCINRFDYCYLTMNSAADIMLNDLNGIYKTLYYYAVKSDGYYKGFIGLVHSDKCLTFDIDKLGELTIIAKMLVNYYLGMKIYQNNLSV